MSKTSYFPNSVSKAAVRVSSRCSSGSALRDWDAVSARSSRLSLVVAGAHKKGVLSVFLFDEGLLSAIGVHVDTHGRRNILH